MKVVLDASAGIAGAMGRDAAPWVVDAVNRATTVLAPDLYVAEVTSGFWKYVITGNLTIEEAMDRHRRCAQARRASRPRDGARRRGPA